jgi:uncharacterized Fe-S radical SAM superfamily protein PflX
VFVQEPSRATDSPNSRMPQILAALVVAAERELRLPLVYNTGGYERLDTLRWLDGIVIPPGSSILPRSG